MTPMSPMTPMSLMTPMKVMTPITPMRRLLPALAIYAILITIGLSTHELFLDEAHHFLLARDSSSLADLYNNARYDGHPRLWHTILFVITHTLSTSPVAMQVLQGIIAIAVAYVFLRYAPFTLLVKIAILFGYYFLFEYSVLSRNYALGLLFLFIACAMLNDGRRPLIAIGVLVLLMCNTHIFFTFASIALYGYLFFEYAAQKKLLTRPFVLFTSCFLLGFACAVIQARVPQVDNVNLTPVQAGNWFSRDNFSFATLGLVRGWLPIPSVAGGRFWNHFWLSPERTGGFTGSLLFLLLLALPAIILYKHSGALLFYYGAVFLLLVFFDVTQMTAARYFGMVFVFFLTAAWLAADGRPDALALATPPARIALYAILALHLLIGAYAFQQDLTRPFSQSRNTSRYLLTLPKNQPIVVDGYNAGPMLCAYLRDSVFYLATGRKGSFCVWRRAYFPNPRPSIDEQLAQWPALSRLPRFTLVSNRSLDTVKDPHFQLIRLSSFGNSIQGENYWVYQVNTH